MANEFYEDQFILDTAGVTLLKASLGVWPNMPLKIKAIRWVGATTATHTCIIQSSDSKVYWESVASGGNYVESDLTERDWAKDFKLTALGSGRVYIYLRNDGAP